VDALKRRRKMSAATSGETRALARHQDEEHAEFPVGPNHARALERRAPSHRAISQAHERGVEMYGHETASEAYQRWLSQEQSDPEGVYGPGGGTAGGIFGDGPVHMSDYDPAARRRTESAQGGAAMVRLGVVLERILDRVEALESGLSQRTLPTHSPRRLGGKP
jgi:hypothetical protein